jgi:hypothetical protein
VELLKEALESMAEDDPIQPGIAPLYTVLHKAKIRAELANLAIKCGLCRLVGEKGSERT